MRGHKPTEAQQALIRHAVAGGLSISATARRYNLARNTVKRVLRDGYNTAQPVLEDPRPVEPEPLPPAPVPLPPEPPAPPPAPSMRPEPTTHVRPVDANRLFNEWLEAARNPAQSRGQRGRRRRRF